MKMTSQIDQHGDQLVVALTGVMTFQDYAAADELLDTVFGRLGGAERGVVATLAFDLSGVTMIDSHWLGMFVRALKRAEEAGVAVVLRGAQAPVRRLLDLVQFDRVFRIEP